MTDDDLDFLARVPAFRRLTRPQLAKLAIAIERRAVAAGEALAEIDARGGDAYVVREGTLRLEIPAPRGPARLVARCGPGTLVGEACLVAPGARSLTIRAEAATAVYVIDGGRFGVLCAADDPGAHTLLRAVALALCDRLREATVREVDHALGEESAQEPSLTVGVEPENTTWRRLQRLFGRAG